MIGYINCRIAGRKETAFLIDEGKFVRFGTDRDIEARLTRYDELVDLTGMYVMPGFVAGGMSFLRDDIRKNAVHLENCRSREEMKNELAAHAEEERIVAFGYRTDLIQEAVDKAFLDGISDTAEIYVFSDDLCLCVLNSQAMKMSDPDLDDEVYGDEGVLMHSGMDYVRKHLAITDEKEFETRLEKRAKEIAANGITTAVSDDFCFFAKDYQPVLTALEKLAFQDRLPLHLIEDGTFGDLKEYAAYLDEGYTQYMRTNRLTMGRVRMRLDGALSSDTAFLDEAYRDDDTAKGTLYHSDEDLSLCVQLANHFNTGVLFHCEGGGAVEQALDILGDDMYEGNPLNDMIAPCEQLTDKQIRKIQDRHIACGLDPLRYYSHAELRKAKTGKSEACPYHTLFTAVKTLGMAPEGNVFACVEALVEREGREHFTLDEALSLYTERGADALGIGDEAGKIQEGYPADFIVLEEDPHDMETGEIHNLRIMMTVTEGERVFEH